MATKREESCRNCRKLFLLRGDVRHTKRLPFLLACGHTLCGVCILSAGRKAKDIVSCTVCGSRTQYNSSQPVEEQFIPNIHLLGLVAARHLNLKCTPRESIWNNTSFSREKAKDFGLELGSSFQSSLVTEAKCEECCSKPAEKKCIQCEGFFCDSCFKIVHAAANSLRRHRAIPAYQASSPAPTCSTHHSKTLSYYCRCEEMPVCPDCIIQSHKEHDVVAIEEVVGEHREAFKILINDAESVLSAIKAKKQEVEVGVGEIKAQSQTVCVAMEHQMKDLYTLLQKREVSLHSLLVKAVDGQLSPLLDMEASLDAEARRVIDVLTRANDCMKNDVLLLQKSAELRESLREVKELTLEEIPTCEHLCFQLPTSVKEALNSAGTILTSTRNSAGATVTTATIAEIIEPTSPSPPPPPPPSSPPPFPLPPPPSLLPSLQVETAAIQLEEMAVRSGGSARSSLSPLAVPFLPKKTSSRGSSVASSKRSSRSHSTSRSRSNTPHLPSTLPRREDTAPVWVSHVESPEQFYIQFKTDENALQKMGLLLNEAMARGCELVGKSEIKEEMKVAGIFSEDGLWYRAEVIACYLNPEPSYVTVLYVDYGNTENLSISQLAKMPSDLDSPYLSHKCTLARLQPPSKFSNIAPVSWSSKATTQLKNFVSPADDNEDSVQVCMKEMSRTAHGSREVELYTIAPDGSLLSINNQLIQMGLATRSKQPSTKFSLPPPPPLPLDCAASGRLEVLVTSCVNPSNFHVRTRANEKLFGLINERLEKRRDRPKVHFTYKGLVCVVKMDERYYRGVVTETGGSEEGGGGGRGGGGGGRGGWIGVRLVDTGAEVQVEVAEVLEIGKRDPDLTDIHSLAIHCKLHNISPTASEDWPIEVIERFKEDVNNTILEMKICGEGKPLPVELVHKHTQQSIGSMLYVEGLATVVMEEKEGENKKKKRRQKKAVSPGRKNSRPPPPGLHPLPGFQQQPKSTPGHPFLKPVQNGTHHHTSSSSTTSAVPPPSLSSSSLVPSSSPATSSPFVPPPPLPSSSPPFDPPSLPSSSPPAVGEKLELTIVQVNSPGDFYFQNCFYQTSIQPQLAMIPKTLRTDFDQWRNGDICLAPFGGERWYRVRVEEKKEDKFRVQYIDFGNCGLVPESDLAVMPQSLEVYPDQAIKAGLAGVAPVGGVEWTMSVSMYFSRLVLDHSVVATVQSVIDGVVMVHIVREGEEDIGTKMIRANKAIIDPSTFALPPSTTSSSGLTSTSASDKEEEVKTSPPVVIKPVRPLENGHNRSGTATDSFQSSPTSPLSVTLVNCP